MKFYNFNRQPLYHTTDSYGLRDMLLSDIFICKNTVYPKNIKAICFSRCSHYSSTVLLDHISCFDTLAITKINTNIVGNLKVSDDVKICFNTDLLIRDGYIPKPINEAAICPSLPSNKITCKSNPNNNKIIPNFAYKKYRNLIEYEERIYKDIKNLHKYILFIEVFDDLDNKIINETLISKQLNIPLLFNYNTTENKKENWNRILNKNS